MKNLLMMTLTGGALALLVMLLRALLGKKLHPRLIYLMWLPVLLSLLIPLRFESPISLRNVPQVQWMEQSIDLRMEEPIGYGMVSMPQTGENHDDVMTDISTAVGTLPDGTLDVDTTVTVTEPALQNKGFGIDAYDILALVWLAGAVVTGGYIALVNLRFTARVRRSRKAIAVPWVLARQMGKTRVYVSKAVPSPCLIGLFAPYIVVTPQAMEEESRLVHVLTHEMMHKRQGDPVWSLLRMAALVVHWFNPIVWVAASLSRSDCENACDALTLRALGEEQRVEYGKTLLSFLRAKPTATALVNAATTMAQSRRQIRRRISLIAKKQRYAWIAAALAITLTLTGCALTMTAPEEDDVDVPPTPAPQEQGTEMAQPTPSPMPVEKLEYVLQDDALRDYAADFERALAPYLTDFDLANTYELRLRFPELEECELYGRENEDGDGYILVTLPEISNASKYVTTYLSISQMTEGDGEEYFEVKRIGALEDGTDVLLKEYKFIDIGLVDGIQGIENALVLIEKDSDPVMFDLHTVSAMAVGNFVLTAYSGATSIRPKEGAYLSVPMLNEELMKATGRVTAIDCYLPVEKDLLEGLKFEPIEEKQLKDFWEDAECMSMMCLHPDGNPENYVMIGADCLVRYEDHHITGVCMEDVYYERFNGLIQESFGIDPFFYIHSKAYNSPENVQMESASLVTFDYETGEVLTAATTDGEKLEKLRKLVFEPDDILTGGAGCPFGGVLKLRTSESEFTFHVAMDSCGVLCYEGNIYLDYGDQADLFEIFPACDPYSNASEVTEMTASVPVTLEVLADGADEWEIFEEDERIQELYELTISKMQSSNGEPAKDDEECLYELDFRDENVARILHVQVRAGSFVVDGRVYPDKKRELLTVVENMQEFAEIEASEAR